jgi:hypothetical protein
MQCAATTVREARDSKSEVSCELLADPAQTMESDLSP